MKPPKAAKQIAQARKKIAEAVKAARADIAEIQGRDELTEVAKADLVAEVRGELREEIDAIGADAAEALKSARSAVQPVAVDPDAEAKARRIWARLERLLDHDKDPVSIADQLASQGDRVGLAVLREELPTYLEVHGNDGPLIEATMSALTRVEGPALTDDELAARDAVTAAEHEHHLVMMNVGIARGDLENTEAVFGHDPADTIHIPVPA